MRRPGGVRHRGPMTDTTLLPTPLDVVGGLYAAFGRGDLPGLLELVDPDVDWSVDVVAPGAELVSMLRNGRGHDAVRGYFAGVADLEFHAFTPHAFHADGDVVLVELSMDVSHRTTGKRARLDEIHHW